MGEKRGRRGDDREREGRDPKGLVDTHMFRILKNTLGVARVT